MTSKQTLREVYLSKRLSLSDKEYQLRNQLITHRILEFIELNKIKSIHLFLPILKKKEFNTYPLIDRIQEMGIETYIPKVANANDLAHYKLDKDCVVEENNWGIPEPVAGTKIKLNEVDLILTPLIIADKRGNRIGYGKGFYDRFLKDVKSRKMGISLLSLLDEIPFIQDNDIPLDGIFSPYETLILE